MVGLGQRLRVRKDEADVRDAAENSLRSEAEDRLHRESVKAATELRELLNGDSGGFEIDIVQDDADLSIVFKDGSKVIELAAGCHARQVCVVEIIRKKQVGSPIVSEHTQTVYLGESLLEAAIEVENRIVEKMGW